MNIVDLYTLLAVFVCYMNCVYTQIRLFYSCVFSLIHAHTRIVLGRALMVFICSFLFVTFLFISVSYAKFLESFNASDVVLHDYYVIRVW